MYPESLSIINQLLSLGRAANTGTVHMGLPFCCMCQCVLSHHNVIVSGLYPMSEFPITASAAEEKCYLPTVLLLSHHLW